MFGTVNSLNELFVTGLRYAYDCEKKLVEKGLPSMIEHATSRELKTGLQHHLEETRTHLARLEGIFRSVGAQPETKTNDILDKMTSAAKDSVSNIEDLALRDAALIMNGNIVEHYEIALYGTLAAFARSLGFQNVAGVLEQTLEEEKLADAKLSKIAESVANPSARRASA